MPLAAKAIIVIMVCEQDKSGSHALYSNCI